MPTDAELFKKYGVDPSKYRLDREAGEFVPLDEAPDIHPADVADEGVGGTIARRAAGAFIPTIASLPVMAKAAQFGAKVPGGPLMKGAGAFGAGLLAGGATGALVGKLQHAAAEGLDPDLTAGWNQQEKINAEANPKADIIGGIAPMAVSNKMNGLKNAAEFAKAFFNPVDMDPSMLAKGAQTALNSGLGGAMEAYHELDRNKPFFGLSPSKIATAAAGNAMFGDFRKPMAKLLTKAGIPMHGDKPSIPEQMRNTPVKPGVGVKAAATVPESGATINQQFADAIDPRTSRMAVFIPKETPYKGRIPEGLTPVERPDGVMYVNEQKGGSVNKAATAPEAPGTELGMSQDSKPAEGDTVVTGQKGGVETTSEVVNGNDPTAVAKAAEAAKAASPDAEVTVKDPAEVIAERNKNNAASRRASVEEGLHLEQTQPEAEPEVGQYPPEGMGTGEIPTPAEVVRRASVKESVDAAAKRKADAARWKAYLEDDGWDTSGMDEDQLANHDTPDPTRRKWQTDQQEKPQPTPKSKISQAWYDLWKKLGFDKYGVTTDSEGKITTDTGEPARGEYDPMNRAVGVDTKRATPDTQPHEIFHAFIQDTLTHGTEGEKAFMRKALEAHEGLKNSKGEPIDAEEALTQATGEHLVGRRDKKNDRLLSDMVAFLRYKTGRATRADMQRLASGAMARGRGFAKEALGVDANATTTGGVKNQPDTKDDRTFVTDFEKELNNNPAKLIQRPESNGSETEPRPDLIFRNPDGTPKTDVTARMYDISAPSQRRANNEPFGLVNKRYQAESEGGDVEYKTPSKAKTPILSSYVDLLRRSKDPAKQSIGNALANAWHERAENQGRYENMVMPLVDKLSKDSQKRVLDHWIETQMTEMDTPIEGGSEKEQAALDAIREMYRQVREDQNAQGMLVRDREGNEREGRFDPTGMPHLIDPDVHNILKNEQGSEKWHSIIGPYRESLIEQLRAKHQTGRKNPMSDAEIESIADAKIRNITGAEPMRGGTAEWKAHSKPLRLAESTKLTPEMIDTNLPRLLEKYIGQVSKDLAFHKYVESKPEIAKLIGEVEDANPRDVLAGNTDVAGALSDYRGDGIKAKGKIEKALGSVSDLAVALLTANPVTRGADFITTGFRGMAAAENPFQIPSVVMGMLKNVATGKAGRDARDTGLIRNMANYMDNLIGNTERVKGVTRKIAIGVSKGTGSEAIERATRTMAQAYGDVLARIYVESAKNGDKTAINHLEQIAPDGEWANLAETDQGIARLATRIAKEFQGVYNNSNLSPHLTDGPAAPMLRMSKWSVEQANNFRKYQIDPLLKHGDAMPLAMYLAVMAGGSAAVQEFREWATGRKSYTPTWAELREGKDGGRVTANAVAKITKAFESVGIAGAYMNLANMAAQAMAGQQSQEIVSPMVQAGTDMTRHVVQGSKAIAEGQDPSLVIPAMLDKMAQSQISMFRIARNWALNNRAKSIRENARDFGTFKLLQGDEKKPFLPIVSYDKMDEKEFDKADMSEAPAALRNSVRRQALNDPSKLPDKLKDLGVIASTGEGPSLKDDEKVLEYIAFIKRTQGADRARQVYRDLLQRDAERKAKREMVGVLRGK